MLNAFASLKCSKKCQHNVQKPTSKEIKIFNLRGETTSFPAPNVRFSDILKFLANLRTDLRSKSYF